MAAEANLSSYEGSMVQDFQVYCEHAKQHKFLAQRLQNILPGEFKRIGAGESSLDVLGVGSGGGEMDVAILAQLQSTFPAVPITADTVEGSSQLTDKFKALIAKTTNLQKIQFAWHIMQFDDYERQVKAKDDPKMFDFIHMIQMVYYLDNLADSMEFYHSLLKNNGKLMIIVASANSGWDILWKTYKKELLNSFNTNWYSSEEVFAGLESLGLKYEENFIPNSFDISECFNPSSQTGQHLLNFMTGTNFYKSFTPEIRAGMLDLLRNKCSTEKDGKVFLNLNTSCIFVNA